MTNKEWLVKTDMMLESMIINHCLKYEYGANNDVAYIICPDGIWYKAYAWDKAIEHTRCWLNKKHK